MRLLVTLGIALAALISAGCNRQSVQQTLSAVEVRGLLSKDCATMDTVSLLAVEVLRQGGNSVFPELYSALRYGPTPAERDTMEVRAVEQYVRVQNYLGTGSLMGLTPPEIVDSTQAMLQPDFVGMVLENYVSGYHQRALNALVALADSTVLEDSLSAIATEPTLPAPIRVRILAVLGP